MLRFHLLPPEHRVVVTTAAVKVKMGIYYERVYGKGDTHAEVWDGARLPSSIRYVLHSASPSPRFTLLRPHLAGGREGSFFCGITEKFVTSNLNKNNLEMECVTYA